MVSYAAPGGGVGPHFDSYDVFLLQAQGQRRWQISTQRDLALIDGAPLRILRRFRAGDGVDRRTAATCSTCRRATRMTASRSANASPCRWVSARPRRRNWRTASSSISASTSRSGECTPTPARAGPRARAHRARHDLAGRAHDGPHPLVARRHGTLPRRLPHGTQGACRVRPARTPSLPGRFPRHLPARGVRLALKSRCCTTGTIFYINGEPIELRGRGAALLRVLADSRALPPHAALPERGGAALRRVSRGVRRACR